MFSSRSQGRPRRVSVVVGLILGIVIPVLVLPLLVNAIAFLAGAEGSATFNPVSHSEQCHKESCHTVTQGYLSGSGEQVTWPRDVPLGLPFTVRVPVWGWGLGHDPIPGSGTAIGLLIVGVIGCGLAFLFLRASVKNARRRRAMRFDYWET
jgi:hypothetical protein